MDKFRCKNFNLVLYPEDSTHYLALYKIQKEGYDYALIMHDRDIDDNGEVKKKHYHCVLRFKNAKWNTALAEELGIAENYIQQCRDLKRSLLYLIHFYDEDKAQYLVKEVQGSLKVLLEQAIKNDGKSESEKVIEIFDIIDKTEYYIYYSTFCRHIANLGYWDVLRRSSGLIMRYIEEHNSNVL